MRSQRTANRMKPLTVKCKGADKSEARIIRRLVRRLKLDRRKVYTVGMFDELAILETYTRRCSGCSCDCSEGGCNHGNSGCDECGYTGKRVESFPCPAETKEGYKQIKPYVCHGCQSPMKHFDAGCPKCAASVDADYFEPTSVVRNLSDSEPSSVVPSDG